MESWILNMLRIFAMDRIDLFYWTVLKCFVSRIFLKIEYCYGFWLILFYEIKLYFYVVNIQTNSDKMIHSNIFRNKFSMCL